MPPSEAALSPAELADYGGWIKRIALLLRGRMPWAELDDLLQWGALGLLEARGRFSSEFGVSFKTFATRRIKGAMLDGLRRSKSFRFAAALDDTELDAHAREQGTLPEDALSQMLGRERQRVLAAALRELAPEDYQILALHFFEELNNREIALVLGCSEGQASKLRARAVQALGILVQAKLEGETIA